MPLAEHSYGKAGIRLVTVERQDGRHHLRDLVVDVTLRSDGTAAYTGGDNSGVLPTDTMRNTVYSKAREWGVDTPESFGLRLARHFVDTVVPVAAASVRLAAEPWRRINVDGNDHPWAFTGDGGGRRTATVTADSGGVAVRAGLAEVPLLKTTESSFKGFLTDDYTTLDPTEDRILATAMTAEWRYDGVDLDWGACATEVHRVLVETFATHDSDSVQHTLYAMGQAVLAARPEIIDIRMAMPNKHHVLVDLAPFGQDNPNQVFVATDRPYGFIEATVVR